MTTPFLWLRSLALGLVGIATPLSSSSAAPGNDAYCVSGNCLDGFGVWRRARDNTYEGEWKNGQFHGQGTRVQRSDRYEGEWSDGVYQGRGLHETKQGRYEGDFVAGRREGWGEFRDARTGARYTGRWSKGKSDGWGRRVDSRGSIYEGQFRTGRREGWGLAEKVGGYFYIGQWRDDAYHGHGFWITASGDRFIGTFERGEPDGLGMRTRANGDHYAGSYRQNKRHGRGVETTASGRIMSGRFDNGIFQGRVAQRGTSSRKPAIGVTAVGCLTGNCVDGDGINVTTEGKILAGHWRGGRREGFGLDARFGGHPSTAVWEDGQSLGPALQWARRESTRPTTRVAETGKGASGCTSGDCQSGRGRYAWPDGRIYEGAFLDGRPHGMGQIRNPDDSVYLGEWVDARPHGRGTLTGADGRVQDGYWDRGRFAGAAAPQTPAATPSNRGPAPTGPASFGRYHALVIANRDYSDAQIDDLITPKKDADALSSVLEKSYGFEVTRIDDASRAQIVSALSGMRKSLAPEDNLLVYYAGHGWLDEKTDEGYWLPVDARMGNHSNWLSNATIATSLRGIDARHILIVADSCFSGTLTRGVRPTNGTAAARRWSDLLRLRSRVSLTSGGVEPVLDGGGGGHSVFARALLGSLRANRQIIDGTTLFQKIREQVSLDANQMPSYGNIRRAGHEVGGDFVFVRRDVKDSPATVAGR